MEPALWNKGDVACRYIQGDNRDEIEIRFLVREARFSASDGGYRGWEYKVARLDPVTNQPFPGTQDEWYQENRLHPCQ